MRAGRAIRDQQNYREPERVASTVQGIHFVPTVRLGGWCPTERLLVGHAIVTAEPVEGWVSYPTYRRGA